MHTVGNVTVSGFGAIAVPPFALDSTLTVTGLSSSLGTGGDSTMTISQGALADFTGNLLIGPGFIDADATGTVTVEGLGFNNRNARLLVGGDVNVGSFHNGTGLLIVNDGGLVVIDGDTNLGEQGTGNTNRLRITDGGELRTHSLLCANSGAALDFRGGLTVIDGGTLDPPSDSLSISSTFGTTPIVELRNGATCALSQLNIGSAGLGELHVTSGSDATVPPAAVLLGGIAGGVGVIAVDGAGSTFTAGQTIHAGTAGVGQLTVTNGGSLTAATVELGRAAGGDGGLAVQGTGAIASISSKLAVGGTSQAPGGTGSVVVSDGGVINATNASESTLVWPGGLVAIASSSTYNNTGEFDLRGSLIIEGGTLNTNHLLIGAAQVLGHGTINGRVSMINNTSAVITASDGPLTLGNPASSLGYDGFNGTLNVGNQTVTLHDADMATLGNTNLAGGTLNMPNGGFLNGPKTLSGFGTVNDHLRPTGLIQPTGSGLQFGGLVWTDSNAVPFNISGTLIRILSTGTLNGFGTAAAQVDADSGSTINIFDDTTMGNAASGAGVVLDGNMHVFDATLTLHDNNGVALGSLTTLNNATIVQGIQIGVGVGRILRGTGAIQSTLINFGAAQPGGSSLSTSGIGTINVSGIYSQGNVNLNGDMVMEIASASSADRLVVGGTAFLAGDLAINLINGFVPALNQTYQILDAATVSGTFANLTLSGAPACLDIQVIYAANDVKIKFVSSQCPADIAPPGGNGAVNIDDLLLVINTWGPGGNGTPGDITTCGSGPVNIDDLLEVITGWGACQ